MYHNAGEKVEIFTNGSPLAMSNDAKRYSASGEIVWERQDVYQYPGWHYFGVAWLIGAVVHPLLDSTAHKCFCVRLCLHGIGNRNDHK